MTATEIIKILAILYELTTHVVEMAKNIGDMSEADEATLREVLAKQRAKNDAGFAEVDALLKARAGQ